MTPADWVAMVAYDEVIFDEDCEGRVRNSSHLSAFAAVAGESQTKVMTSTGQGDITLTTGPVRHNSQRRSYHRFCEIHTQRY